MTNAIELEGTEYTNVSLRYNKEDIEVSFDELSLEGEPLSQNASDEEIKTSIENYRDMASGALDSYVVEKYARTGQVVVRPQTEWGK